MWIRLLGAKRKRQRVQGLIGQRPKCLRFTKSLTGAARQSRPLLDRPQQKPRNRIDITLSSGTKENSHSKISLTRREEERSINQYLKLSRSRSPRRYLTNPRIALTQDVPRDSTTGPMTRLLRREELKRKSCRPASQKITNELPTD